MRLHRALLTVGLAYYCNGGDETELLRATRYCIRKLSPGSRKPLKLILLSHDPAEMLRLTLEEVYPEMRTDEYYENKLKGIQ